MPVILNGFDPQILLFATTLLCHIMALLPTFREPRRTQSLNFKTGLSLEFGSLLLTRDEDRAGIMGLASGATREMDLSWRDWSLRTDLYLDGGAVVFDDQGEQMGPSYAVAIRDLRRLPPVPLGEGMSGGISPDGKWVAATVDYTQIVLLPTGVGTSRKIDCGGIQQYGHWVRWLPD